MSSLYAASRAARAPAEGVLVLSPLVCYRAVRADPTRKLLPNRFAQVAAELDEVRLGGGHDFEKLCGVYELSELRELAVAHVPDVHDREVQLLARVLSGARVAHDHCHRVP